MQWDWPAESVAVIDGSVPKDKRARLIAQRDVVIVNYEAAYRDPVAKALLTGGFGLLILDESHRIKAAGGVISRFVSRLSDRIPKRLAMTGTPMPHSPMDIYAQMRAVDKKVFGTSAAMFRARYARMGGYGGKQIVSWLNTEDMRRRIDFVTMHVRSDDVLDLPETLDTTIHTPLPDATMRALKQLRAEFVADVQDGVVTASNALVRLLREAQITGGAMRVEFEDGTDTTVTDNLAKHAALKQILEDSGESHVVVFCRFHNDLDSVHDAAKSIGTVSSWELSGRTKQLEDWKKWGGVLAVQIQSGGLGVDLTAARLAVYYSLGFSLGEYLQSRARLHRPGQTRKVLYTHLVAPGTVDVEIMRALAAKQDVVESILHNRGGEA